MANLFPAANRVSSEGGAIPAAASGSAVKFGRSWRFDYDRGDFVTTPTGKIAGCLGTEAWLEWCKKTIRTERYTYLVYSRKYGQEYEEMIGRFASRASYESEIARMTAEALKTDPRTASVSGFSFSWEQDRCFFQCDIANARGQTFRIDGSVVTM